MPRESLGGLLRWDFTTFYALARAGTGKTVRTRLNPASRSFDLIASRSSNRVARAAQLARSGFSKENRRASYFRSSTIVAG
jgi:hypothetical protein